MVATLLGFSASVLWLHARWGRAQFDAELESLGAETSRVIQEELSENGNLRKAVAEARESIDVPDRAMAILDLSGQPLGAHWHGFEYAAPVLAPTTESITTVRTNGTDWRVLTRRESSRVGDYVILIAGPLDTLARQQSFLTRVLGIATPLLILITAGVSWWVASAALSPMTTMASQADTLTSRSTDFRLPGITATDELGSLARAFNRLLDRLSAALRLQRQFMADASHELRTPVSVIQTAAEVTLQRETRESWEYRDALAIIGEQSARLTRMVEDMLVLARADAGAYTLAPTLLYIDEIVAECVRAVSVIATTRDVALVTDLQPDVSMIGDDGLLRRLMMNLLDNAVQYTPAGGKVTVTLTCDAMFATITFSDTGPGIRKADRERVFERFVRLDPSRSEKSGAGLGLPIARWIAEEHGGTVTVEENKEGGCQFIARLALKHSKINRE
jgi:two-component system, OmpR family, sensor kinase